MSDFSTSNSPSKPFIFNQPSWSNPQQIGTADDFFHRSNQTYVDITAESERRRKAREARKRRLQKTDGATKERTVKRQRVSDESEDDDSSSGYEETNQARKHETEADLKSVASDHVVSSSPKKPTLCPQSLSKRYEDTITASKVNVKIPHPSNVIDLEEEEDNEEAISRNVKEANEDGEDSIEVTHVKVSIPPDEDEFPVSDDEFADLARKAREKARRKRLEEEFTSTTPDSLPSTAEDGDPQRSQSSYHPILQPSVSEPVVQILITSRLTGTEPLIVCRRLSQRLKDVRIAWCQRQGFEPDFIHKVFLTWKGKRLFDVTTCKSLGIVADANGDISRDQSAGDDGAQVHMEAMTSELFDELQKQKRRGMIENDGNEDENVATEDTSVTQKQEVQVRIILKAKGFEDFKLIVKPVGFAKLNSWSVDRLTVL